MRFLSLFILALIPAGLVHADDTKPLNTYTYRVRLAQTERSCAEEASLLAARFHAATRFELVKSECGGASATTDGNHPLNIFVVTYMAEYLPRSFSVTLDPEVYWPKPSENTNDLYTDYNDCAADLPNQTARFEANTGLVAVAAYCEPKDSFARTTVTYRLKIESFGDPKTRLFDFHNFRNFDELATNQVRAMLTGAGASIVKEKDGEVFYYAVSPVNVSTNSFAAFENSEQCTAQISDAAAILEKLGAKQIVIRCAPRAELGGVELNSVSDTGWAVSNDYGLRSPAYYSFGECMQDKPRYLDERGSYALGGICARDITLSGDVYKIDVFSRL